MRARWSYAAALVLVAIASHARALGPDVVGPYFMFRGAGLSGDGSCIVGDDATGNQHAPVRWFVGAAEFEPIGDPGWIGVGLEASTDCSTVVGYARWGGAQTEAFRWTEAGGLVQLGILPNTSAFPSSHGHATSADGSVVVGRSQVIDHDQHAFAWTESGGMVDLGLLPGDEGYWAATSVANDVSADGNTIVGYSFAGTDPFHFRAARWTESGAEPLPDLPGGFDWSIANAVSADGSIVVGFGSATSQVNRGTAVRWVDGALESLGDLPGGAVRSTAFAVSADGEVVVGDSTATGGVDKAFLWTQRSGMRSIEEILTVDFQVDLDGLAFTHAWDISDDGLQILVEAAAGEMYVVRLPDLPGHPACDDHADDDGDGLVDYPADPGCQNASSPLENPQCDDDLDNDGDGKIDWDGGAGQDTPDPHCAGAGWRNREKPQGCGLGVELVLLAAPLCAFVRGRNRRSPDIRTRV